jgi:hypothetical protein
MAKRAVLSDERVCLHLAIGRMPGFGISRADSGAGSGGGSGAGTGG